MKRIKRKQNLTIKSNNIIKNIEWVTACIMELAKTFEAMGSSAIDGSMKIRVFTRKNTKGKEWIHVNLEWQEDIEDGSDEAERTE